MLFIVWNHVLIFLLNVKKKVTCITKVKAIKNSIKLELNSTVNVLAN